MKNGIKRFDYFLNQLQLLLNKSAQQKNPALWLYRNNVRTPLFMLEALSKMYAGIHHKKKFTKLKAHFKLLEDGLGAIDYYDTLAKEFSTIKKIPAAITTYLQAQAREKIQSLNEVLTEKEWLGANNRRIFKIKNKLAEVEWKNEEDEIKSINDFYGSAIYEIAAFVQESKFTFDNVEKDVHELRRKLRWLSIYPQALRGSIQLSKSASMPKYLAKYLTPAITGSPYNIMPDAGENQYFLLLDKNHFYSLSWIIAELGGLKDIGLRIVAIREALQQTSTITDIAAFKKAQSMLGTKQPGLEQLLTNAGKICKVYFTEHNLEHLVKGIAEVKN